MTEIWKRLLPGLGLVTLLGGFAAWSWWMQAPVTPVKAAVVRTLPQPAWTPDPRVATLDGIVRDLEKDNGRLRVEVRERGLTVEALQAELARLDWLLKTRTADKPKATKKRARKCSPLKIKE